MNKSELINQILAEKCGIILPEVYRGMTKHTPTRIYIPTLEVILATCDKPDEEDGGDE